MLKIASVLFFALTTAAIAQPQLWGTSVQWGDQGNGTYRNPVLPADFSDLDAIRVGDDYYAMSSTLHLSPGMAVLHSKDLVNWNIISHVVPDTTQLGTGYNWDQMSRYGRGVWAGSLRHHNGRFYAVFGTPDEGFFMSQAENPAGPWTPVHPLLAEKGWDDCTILWDGDGQAYFIGTKFADGYKTYAFKISADAKTLDRDSAILINEGNRREASKLLKRGGYYYLIFSEFKADMGRYMMAKRSKSPMGPYGEERILTLPNREAKEPNQGGIIEGPDGKWYFFTHHGTGDWEGRAASLLPVAWTNDWPVIGDNGAMVWGGTIPVAGTKPAKRLIDEVFSRTALTPDWEWNHQPRASHWSLTARKGHLRLKAWQPIKPNDFYTTGNVASVRTYRTAQSVATAKLDLGGMVDGQYAGLVHFSKTFASLGVSQTGKTRRIAFKNGAKTLDGPVITQKVIWLKSTQGLTGQTRFAYSLNGKDFKDFGTLYQPAFARYRGDRTGVYTVNTKADAGHVDIDRFTYRYQ